MTPLRAAAYVLNGVVALGSSYVATMGLDPYRGAPFCRRGGAAAYILNGVLIFFGLFVLPLACTSLSTPTIVIIDRTEQAFTVYAGVAGVGEGDIGEIRTLAAQDEAVDLVNWEQFELGVDSYVEARVAKDEYPGFRAVPGIIELIKQYPGTQFGLTWNGGIAITAMDYGHARGTYQRYLANPEEYERTRNRNPAEDPVNPRSHLCPLLGWCSVEPTEVDESLQGSTYLNRTGNFTLTLPDGWKIAENMRSPGAIAALTSTSGEHLIQVSHDAFSDSLKAYKEKTERQWKEQLHDYQKLDESHVTVNGRPAVFLIVRGKLGGELPLKLLLAFMPHDDGIIYISATTREPLFDAVRSTFEEVVLSFKPIDEEVGIGESEQARER